MSFLAKLIIDHTEYAVLKAVYSIDQADDETGLPNERTTGGKLFLTVQSVKSTDAISWAMSNKSLKNGELIFYNRDSVSVFRKIVFENAFCLRFKELFDSDNKQPLSTEIVVSARKLIIKDAIHENDWPQII